MSKLQHFLYQLDLVCAAHPDVNDCNALQFSLINAYRRNSTLVSLLVEACLLRQVSHGDVPQQILVEFIENRMPVLARANRTGEIIWLLFLAIRLGLTISASRLTLLFSIENAFIAVLVVCLDTQRLLKGNVDRGFWDRSLTAEGLRSPMWLYAYEAVTQGFLPGLDDGFIVRDPYFTLLRAKRVQFLDIKRGYDSITRTLRGLRNENERLKRVQGAIQNEDFDDLDELDNNWDDPDIY
jgi:hypothetical protein